MNKKISIITLSLAIFLNPTTSFSSSQINAEVNQESTETSNINKSITLLNEKINEVKTECSGIKSDIKTLFGLTTATMAVSGSGAFEASGALAVGMIKEKQERAQEENTHIKTSNNVRTGLMIGAATTSAGATTTSVISAVSADKLAKKMESCNAKLSELNIIKGELEAELNDQNITEMPKVMTDASDIIGACEKYEKKSIENVKGLMIGSSIASGIGTATAGVGTFASIKAGKGEDIKVGKKDGGKTFDSDKVANIMAGVTAGTSATSTGLSAGAMSQAKKDIEKAEKCEAKLAE